MEVDANIIAVGKDEGILFDFDRMEQTPNTLDQRLIWLADREGIQDTVVEALFIAYFANGRDISNQQTLIDVIVEAGINRKQAETTLNSDVSKKKPYLPEKICIICNKPFKWRKKWEKVWEQVKYCSEKCRRAF